MRLINLDKLLDDIHRTVKESGLVNHECEIMDCIKYADIIDTDIEAEPVRHGRWIFKHDVDKDPKRYFVRIVCSNCNLHTGQKSNYCPQCGAKMDLND